MSEPIHHDETHAVVRRTVPHRPRWTIFSTLIGRPLPTADAPHQTIGVPVGLAVFASDALSSTAYATQEILVILAAAATILPTVFNLAVPISIAIVALLLVVTVSYEQTIHAYPGGGGAYIVARDNFGDLWAQTAGAALLTDYILTVSVSVAAGVAQIASAYPALFAYRELICIFMILFVMMLNLRGVRESGFIFAIPTYFFLATMVLTLSLGFYAYFTHALGVVADPPAMQAIGTAGAVSLFLILHAFSSGTTALTGIEAVSNGITAFREPRSRNAGLTLLWLSGILSTLFLGITYLSVKVGAVPSEVETVISQLARTVFHGQGTLYLCTVIGTMIILIMAANTSFAGFPRLSALQAADGFLPRQLNYRGSRLVFSRGIVTLALISSALIVFFQASVTRLIPLYAIGVFLSFTLSQAGMARRWWKIGHLAPGVEVKERGSTLRFDPRWVLKMMVNGFGCICTGVVMFVFAITKFHDGAWIVVFLIPALVAMFYTIHQHYKRLEANLSLERHRSPPRPGRHRVIMPVSGVHRGTLAALRYARSLSDDVTAVHISTDSAEAEEVRRKWEVWGDGIRLVILDSPFRLLVEPLLQYIEDIASQRQPDEVITIVVPQYIPSRWWHNFLHTQTAIFLRMALLNRPGIVITDVPYHME